MHKPNRKRQRAKRTPVSVHQVQCKGCQKKYILISPGKVLWCGYCQSDNIAVSSHRETPEERNHRKQQEQLRAVNAIGQMISGLIGGLFNGGRAPIARTSELEAEILKEGYRKLAQKYHPDKGGDPTKMRELNRLKEKHGL